MPKTKFQNFIFTLMTVVLMAYCMIVYSLAINSPEGLINQTFLIALKEFPIEGIIVFLLAFFVGPLVRNIFRILRINYECSSNFKRRSNKYVLQLNMRLILNIMDTHQ